MIILRRRAKRERWWQISGYYFKETDRHTEKETEMVANNCLLVQRERERVCTSFCGPHPQKKQNIKQGEREGETDRQRESELELENLIKQGL